MNRMPFTARDAVLKRLGELADLSTLNKQDNYQYQSSLKFLRDTLAEHEYSINKGLAEGMEKGMQKGLQEGLQKGMQKGMQKGLEKGRADLIRKFLSAGMAEDQVAKIVEMSVEEMRNLLAANPE